MELNTGTYSEVLGKAIAGKINSLEDEKAANIEFYKTLAYNAGVDNMPGYGVGNVVDDDAVTYGREDVPGGGTFAAGGAAVPMP